MLFIDVIIVTILLFPVIKEIEEMCDRGSK